MGKVISLQGRSRIERMSEEELRHELRAALDQSFAYERQLAAIAEALWPEDDSERPGDLEDISGADIVEGVKSLHELTDRVHGENDHLRGRLLALMYPDGERP